MYRILEKANGEFHCEVGIQDGTEYWVEKSLDDAVQAVKRAAKFLNGQKIKKKEIKHYRETVVNRSEWKRV